MLPKNTSVKQAKSKRGGKHDLAESPEARRKGKKAKRRHSIAMGSVAVDNNDHVIIAGPVHVNDPTLEPSVSKPVAHDIWHFFVKGKAGGKTVCKVCEYI